MVGIDNKEKIELQTFKGIIISYRCKNAEIEQKEISLKRLNINS